MKTKNWCLLSISVLLYLTSLCQSSDKLHFVENKGQWHEQVKYKGELNNGAFFLTGNGFKVVQQKADDLRIRSSLHNRELSENTVQSDFILHSHAYEVNFLLAGSPVISSSEMINSYNNYFIGNDPAKWAGNCKIYNAVTYRNMYPGIDVKYYSSFGKVKYDIIVNAGADISKITMQYTGADGLDLVNGNLIIKTSVGDIQELAPYAYQQINGAEKKVACNFKIDGNIVSFETDSFDKSKSLIIDPTLVFSTFTGSTGDNWGYAATYGPDGSAYAAGIVFGLGYPVNNGAFNTMFSSGTAEGALQGYDIGVIKFSPDGTNRIYATYLGGFNNEAPLSMITDQQGNLYLASRTSSINFPTTTPTYGPGGNYDIVVSKFNATGSALLASRKFGGSDNDGVNISLPYVGSGGAISINRNYNDHSRSDIQLDNAGNIIVASCTKSVNFPVSAGAFQTGFGGLQDGILLKTNPDLSTVIFSSFIGGSGDDAAFTLAINPVDNNIYIAGSTTSSNLPGNKTGVLNSSFVGGSTDGFISIIPPAGNVITKTTYLGTSGVDMLYGLQFDNSGYPYIMGTSTSNWPILNAAFYQFGGKQFIAKLQPDLSAFVYATTFGTNSTVPNLSPVAFGVDCNENVYMSGWGGKANTYNGIYPNAGTTGLTTTSNAIQSITDGHDFYFFVLAKNATAQLYGSFYGQYDATGGGADHVDGGTSRFDASGTLYQAICANCGRTGQFPTTPGAWATTNGSINCNQAVVKLSMDICGGTFPVHLQNFSGRSVNNVHEIKWQVSNEEKGDAYHVERTFVANGQFQIAYSTTVKSASTSNKYTIWQPAENRAETFYRLKIISITGGISYSNIVVLKKPVRNNLDAYILQNDLHITTPAGARSISIYNVDGKLIYQQVIQSVSGITLIPLHELSKGILVVKMQLQNEVLVKKMLY